MVTRRTFLSTAAGLAAAPLVPAWARSAADGNTGIGAATRHRYDFAVAKTPLRVNGRRTEAVTIGGGIPAPLMRMREGEEVVIRVRNTLDEPTSVHWHGLLVPFGMDGVPGVSFPGIGPGETFEYRFPLRQSGTYWYHSHSGLQEQLGLYGPIVIDPAGPDPIAVDREYVLVLGDWTYRNPYRLFRQLKTRSDSLNFQKRAADALLSDIEDEGLGDALSDRARWGGMRMARTDIADVTGATYTYLINGHGPDDDWTALFVPGERVRLRIINASAMSLLNMRIPGLPMRVVAADGNRVRPVETDEFQIGPAETYDVVVAPEDRAYRLVAAAIDGSGQALGTLTPRLGERAETPPLRPRPLLTMADMGMDHSGMGHSGMDHGDMAHDDSAQEDSAREGMGHGAMAGSHQAGMNDGGETSGHAGMHAGHQGMNHAVPPRKVVENPPAKGPGVASIAAMPTNRLDEPGIGLSDLPHRTLSYAQLAALAPNPDTRPPGREVVVHLTSNMERYMWSFDGVRFSEVTDSIRFYEGERVRLTLVNDTMMPHPIHLHGMFFDVVVPDAAMPGAEARHLPRKHTIIVKPGETLSVDISAEEVGDWAFHCHLLYHMYAGMMQVVSVLPKDAARTARASETPHGGYAGHH